MDTQPPPQSAVRWWDPLLIAAAVIISYALCFDTSISNAGIACLLGIAVMAVTAAVEIMYAPWRGLPRPHVAAKTLIGNWLVKLLGWLAGYGIALLCWKFVPEFARAGYDPFFRVASIALFYIPLVVGIFTLFTEWRLGPQEDHAWHMGQLLLGR